MGGLSAPRTVIYGCLSDKDIEGVLSQLARYAERIIAVPPPSYRAMNFEQIVKMCRAHFAHAEAAEDVCSALANCGDRVIAVCGTFTILKEAEKWIDKGQ